jgi:hypothetical protein
MKIKISIQNSAALEAALAKANGRATVHTFKWAFEIIEIARKAEAKLDHLALKKGSRKAAIARASSGGTIANAYRYPRITSTATLVRGSSAWFLVSAGTTSSFCRKAGDTYVSLTSSQDAEVTATFRSQFGKQPVTTVTAGGAA